MRNITKSLTFLGAMLVASQSQALLIDSFNTTMPQTVSSSGTLTSTVAGGLGGSRRLDIISSSGPLNTSASVVTISGAGLLAHSEDVGTSGVSRVTWNSNGLGLGGGLGINLTANNEFFLDTLTIDQGSMDVTIGLTDTSTLPNTASVTLFGITSNPSFPSISFYSFLDPLNPLGDSDFDFTSVREIYLEINATQASDITLDEIRTQGGSFNVVPEPATFLLMGVGLLGMLGMRRRNAAR